MRKPKEQLSKEERERIELLEEILNDLSEIKHTQPGRFNRCLTQLLKTATNKNQITLNL